MLKGRDSQVAVIGESLAATLRGEGTTLLVEGPPGIGKSSLLAEARAMAVRAGVRALTAEASESQQTVPFAPLLAATLDSEPPIGRVEQVRGLDGQPGFRYWMLHDLQDALESAALQAPLAVILDDLQWADSGTLVALSRLPARLSGLPILWILALRRGESRPAVLDAMARLERCGARRLRLGALSQEAVAAVVADILRAPADPALLQLAANARGNPFLLVELIDGLREEDRVRIRDGRAVVVGEGLPRRLADSMRERLDRLSADARQTLRVASVLGHRFTAELLATMLQRRASALVPAVEEALRADLLVEVGDRLAFRHDLLRQAVLQTLPRSLRRGLQREAATVLLESGAAPVEVAQQLADSAAVGDREAIAQLRAAARVLAGSDAQAAADMSVRALELVPAGDAARGPLVAETIVLLHAAMRPDEAGALGERELAGALPSAQEAEVRLRLSAMFMRSMVSRAEENHRALALPGLAPELRARHLGWLTYNLAIGGHLAQVETVAESALAAATDAGEVQGRAMAMAGLTHLDCSRGRFPAALARAEELGRLTRPVEREPWVFAAAFQHANVLTGLGRLDAALRVVVANVRRARRERCSIPLEGWARYASSLRLALGQLGDARAEAEASEAGGTQSSVGSSAAATPRIVTLAQVAVHTGDAQQLRASVATARSAIGDNAPVVRRAAAWILALAAAARNDPADAVRWLYDDELPYAMVFMPFDAGHQPTVARIALAAGDGELARRAVEVAESFARGSPNAALFSATAAQARGLLAGDSALLLDAARELRATQRPLVRAAACEDAGRALAGEGHARDAVAILGEALDVYVACEADADARRVSRLLREHGVRRRIPSQPRPASGWASLTESELRVARLVADGARNRDAAERLYLSPHTVSSHLRSTFAKLGINSRIELARIVLEQDGAVARRG